MFQRIPEIFKKYMKANSLQGVEEFASSQKINTLFKEHILKSNNGRLILCQSSHDKKRFYAKEDVSDVAQVFLSQTWKNCKLEDKLKCVEFFVDEMFKGEDCQRPEIRYIAKNTIEISDAGIAFYDHRTHQIFLNLDKMVGCSGVRWLEVLFHECYHAKDFYAIEKDFGKILETYCTDASHSDQDIRTIQQIIELPTTDLIYNYKTGRNEIVTPALRDRLLRLKNTFVLFMQNKDKELGDITTREDMQNYLYSLMYYVSPLERRARVATKLYLRDVKNKFDLEYDDESVINRQIEQEDRISQNLEREKDMILAYKDKFPIQCNSLINLLDILIKRKFYQDNAFHFANFDASSSAVKLKDNSEHVLNEVFNIIYAEIKSANMLKNNS